MYQFVARRLNVTSTSCELWRLKFCHLCQMAEYKVEKNTGWNALIGIIKIHELGLSGKKILGHYSKRIHIYTIFLTFLALKETRKKS